MLIWLLVTFGVVIGLGAVVAVRRVARQLDGLNEAYWELRYEHTRLRARVARLDPGPDPSSAEELPSAAAPVAFVPLSSLKR